MSRLRMTVFFGCLALLAVRVSSLPAQSVIPTLGFGVETWATGRFAREGAGLSVQGALGLQTSSRWRIGVGLRRWTPPSRPGTGLLWSLFLRAERPFSERGKVVQPVLGVRVGAALYGRTDDFDPFTGIDFGAELGVQLALSRGAIVRVSFVPSYITFVDEQGGLSVGMALALTRRERP
jgi:hypothetical protein